MTMRTPRPQVPTNVNVQTLKNMMEKGVLILILSCMVLLWLSVATMTTGLDFSMKPYWCSSILVYKDRDVKKKSCGKT